MAEKRRSFTKEPKTEACASRVRARRSASGRAERHRRLRSHCCASASAPRLRPPNAELWSTHVRIAFVATVVLSLTHLACEAVPDIHFAPACSSSGQGCVDASLGDAGAAADAAAADAMAIEPADGATIACGAVLCDLATTTCCVSRQGSYVCLMRGFGCPGIDLQCADSDDCSHNAVCCATLADGGAVKHAACSMPQACTRADGTAMCEPDAAAPCPASAACTPSSIAGFSICK